MRNFDTLIDKVVFDPLLKFWLVEPRNEMRQIVI